MHLAGPLQFTNKFRLLNNKSVPSLSYVTCKGTHRGFCFDNIILHQKCPHAKKKENFDTFMAANEKPEVFAL